MKILTVADEISKGLWDYYSPGKLVEYDLILSSGDLKAEYLSFLVTMARCPLFYVHGNHDHAYAEHPPEGCDCIDDKLVVYKGLRILGLGGSRKYSRGAHQYTEREMEKRIRKLSRAIKMAGGVDIVLAHAAPRGVGDQEDLPHQGFESFLELIDTYHPQYFLHGHVHLNYGNDIKRLAEYGGTPVINCCEKYVVDGVVPGEPPRLKNWQKLYCRFFLKNYESMDF